MNCFLPAVLADNGIREPLYVTAMRYAGIDITKEKRPAHVDSVVLNEGDRKRLQEWFEAQPFKEETGEREKLLEVKNLSFGYTKEHQTLHNVSLSIDKGEMVSIVGREWRRKIKRFPNLYVDLRIRIPERFCSMEKIC